MIPLVSEYPPSSREMKIDGVDVSVDVALDGNGLNIRANTREGLVKTITVEREEALYFIGLECEGELQNVFDHLALRESALCLVSRQLNKATSSIVREDPIDSLKAPD